MFTAAQPHDSPQYVYIMHASAKKQLNYFSFNHRHAHQLLSCKSLMSKSAMTTALHIMQASSSTADSTSLRVNPSNL
jgi:hypothetical protein